MAVYKSEVWAGKVQNNEVTEIPVYLGMIEFSTIPEAFVKTIRMYNKNAKRHIYNPQFTFKNRQYYCWSYGSKNTNRGYTRVWALDRCVVGKGVSLWQTGPQPSSQGQYFMTIPKSKVNLPDAVKYVREGPY